MNIHHQKALGEMMNQTSRDGFTSSFGVLVATLGSAVGLGNIWKFPSLTGANGGAGFLLVYLLATLLVGLPVMIVETMLGRAARANAVSAFERVAPRRQWWWKSIGWMGFAAALLILAFYSEVAGWVYAYVFKAMAGEIATTDPQVAGAIFSELVANPLSPCSGNGWCWRDRRHHHARRCQGHRGGDPQVDAAAVHPAAGALRAQPDPAGRERRAELPVQPGSGEDHPAVLLTALGLAFFKLSIGMGCMLTYGSYFRDNQNIPLTATRVMFADLSVSLLAGIAIFPAVFAFGFEPAAGPSLVFMTIPAVFTAMPGGTLFMTLFFILTAIASVGAMLSLLEVPVAILSERFGLGRKRASLTTIGASPPSASRPPCRQA
jgi:NSS family neurotransmitter:Na+ symporter